MQQDIQKPNTVLVCGLPASGNRLTRHRLKISGVGSQLCHFLPVPAGEVQHASEYARQQAFLTDGELWPAAICPVRDRDSWEASLKSKVAQSPNLEAWMRPAYMERHAACMAQLGDRVHFIRLEDIAKSGGEALDLLFHQLGIEPAPWPTKTPQGEDYIHGPAMAHLVHKKRYVQP